MTPTEIRAYNAGVQAVLDIAHAAAAAIAATSKRKVHEDFAVAALAALVESGQALLLPIVKEQGEEGQAP